MEGTPQKPKNCGFCTVRSFSGSHFQGPCGFPDFRLLGQPKWKEPHKSPKFVDFVESAPFPEAISKAPVDFLDFRSLGPPKWREPHKSPKVVDFVQSAPFPEAISGPCGFLGFPASGTAEMKGTPQKPSILYSPLLFRKPFPRPLWISWISGSRTAEMEGTPQKPKIC